MTHAGFTIWLTGMSSSGKTSLARALKERLMRRGFAVEVLDSGRIRARVNSSLGYSREVLLRKSLRGLGRRAADPDVWAEVLRAVRTRGVATHEDDLGRADGSALPVEIAFRSVVHDGHERLVGVGHEVGEQRKVQEALRSLREGLLIAQDEEQRAPH